jgi:hypothetical protein
MRAAGRTFLFLTLAAAVQIPPGAITVEGALAPPSAPSPPPATQPLTDTTPGPDVRSFDIVASGDLLIHSQIYQRALSLGHGRYDFRPLFAPIRSIVSHAALAICHVETPLAAGSPSGYPTFRTPVELAAAIRWTGWDACDTASNHTMDQRQDGVVSTLDALDRAGVKHAGSYRSAAEAARILMLHVEGVKIAFLAYAYGSGAPIGEPWSLNVISLPKIEADARRARRMGASLVVANFHWGQEFVHTPTDQQVSLAETLLRRHIVDLIIGQHVHVVQPIREIGGRFVVFGEGNLISAQTIPLDREGGLIAVIHVRAVGRRARITGVDYIPTWVEQPGETVLPVGAALSALTHRGLGSSALAEELRTSYRITVAAAGLGPHIHPIPARLR